MGEPARVYDQDDAQPVTKPSLTAIDGGGEGDGKPIGSLKALSSDDLKDKETSNDSLDSSDNSEKSSLFSGEEKPSKFTKLKGRLSKNVRRRATIGIVAGALGFGGFAGFAILHGPMEIIHFSHQLQKHFKSNENFGEDRSMKHLIYALAGKGTQRAKLGVTGNYVSDKMEAKITDRTGLKPVYDKTTGRLRGYYIQDAIKSHELLGSNQSKLNQNFGKDAKLSDVDGTLRFANDEIPGRGKFIDLSAASSGVRRSVVKYVAGAAFNTKGGAYITSRLLKKRAGVSFHWLNKIKDRAEGKLYQKRIADAASDGVKEAGIQTTATEDTDNDGNPDSVSENTENVDKETRSFMEDFKKTGVFKTAGSGAVVVGVLCMAKSFGNDIPKYKYEHTYLPLLRTGVFFTSAGEQTKSGENFNLESLRMTRNMLHQNDKNWNQAESIVAENGQSGGVPMRKEASLEGINQKPIIFEILDNVPGLGTACSASDALFGLPVIGDAVSALSTASEWLINKGLNIAGTSTDELVESATRMAAGKTVDLSSPDLNGADFGNYANTGAFLAANDAIIAQGGVALTATQSAELKSIDEANQQLENSQKSFFAKYFDVFDPESLAGQTAMSINNGSFISFGNIFSDKAEAATLYDYGVPKFGFSIDEQDSDKYEDPYANAKLVEPKLDELNSTYGDKCFGMTVIATDEGVRIQNGTSVNVFTEDYQQSCMNNNNEMFIRYRFYISDAVSLLSQACFLGQEDDPVAKSACEQIGASSSATSNSGGDEGSASIKSTFAVESPGVFVKLPSKYSCAGRETEIDSRIAPALTYILTTYNLCSDDGKAGGHKSHGAGFGVDIRPKDQSKQDSKDEWKNTAERFLRDISWWGDSADEPKSQNGCARYIGYGTCVGGARGPDGTIPKWVRWIGYNGDVDHGDPWHVFGTTYAHIHVGWNNPQGDAVSSAEISSPRSSAFTFPAPIYDDIRPLLSVDLYNELSQKYNTQQANSPQSGASTGTPIDGSAKEIAQQILAKNNIDLVNYCRYCKTDIQNMAAGNAAYGNVYVDTKILKFILDLSNNMNVDVNSITGAGTGHSNGSNHYRGLAVDFECNMSNGSLMDSIANKYGIKTNFERCDQGVNHWHYSVNGR